MAGQTMLALLTATVLSAVCSSVAGIAHPENHAGLAINGVPAETREGWMRLANEVCLRLCVVFVCSSPFQAIWATGDPCPQAPFGSVIVNTTSNELVCVASNKVGSTGGDSVV
jgi:hypothetical protein